MFQLTHDDATAVMTSREETVLPPIDPSIGDENEWPEFELTDAKVLRPGKMLYANLLEASEQTPVQVIGCLELKKAQEELRTSNLSLWLSQPAYRDGVRVYQPGVWLLTLKSSSLGTRKAQ